MTSDKDELRFSVDILLSEPLHFQLDEIVEAINADFPSCQVKDPGMNPSNSLRTDEAVIAILDPVEPANGERVVFVGVGFPDENFRNADHTESFWRTGGFGQEALAEHQSYLSVSVTAVDDSLASRFRAARLLNVVTAVFAQLPITLALYVKWGGHFVSPEHWQKAAEQAVVGDWPLTAWLSYRGAWDAKFDQSQTWAVGYSVGLKQFLPYELQMEAAPLKPTDVMGVLLAAAWMPLQGGSVLNEGDTIGVEEVVRYRIRQRRHSDGSPSDIFVLLHPDSPIDEEAVFGPRPGVPTPVEAPFIRNPKKNFMQRLLGRN
ncbi:hypothetical protein TRL7639_03502 [Falsiruegeria litorea R37]|uniref:DUF4261 domain-containing protein n=1 Tax=Falsiruegeria litorea R37 TaxID=1200284 RepID=A0A1Y5TI57_9RHOB|nr:DUF4261 domain-containing protein [Falsiruegeria litorea]SLN62575.1 hypothetical protein TRL7639_03502 [Falsiruegeria litorea R37]